MTADQWIEATKLALEILRLQREGALSDHQAECMFGAIGFNGLSKRTRGPGREMNPAPDEGRSS